MTDDPYMFGVGQEFDTTVFNLSWAYLASLCKGSNCDVNALLVLEVGARKENFALDWLGGALGFVRDMDGCLLLHFSTRTGNFVCTNSSRGLYHITPWYRPVLLSLQTK